MFTNLANGADIGWLMEAAARASFEPLDRDSIARDFFRQELEGDFPP
jgi:hypothetical protein